MSAIDVVVRALLLVVIAAGVTAALRRSAASLRALIWTGALGGALALPMLLSITPAWRIEIARPAPAAAPFAAVIDDSPASTTTSDRVSEATPPPAPTDSAAVAAAAAVAEGSTFAIDWRAIGLAAAFAITLLLLARLVAGHVHLRRLARRAAPNDDPEWQAALEDGRRQLGVRVPVTLLVSDSVSIPAVAGIFRATLLLPVDARDWHADVRRAVLLHELAHVARRDALAQLVSQAACALYWYLPPMWLGARRAAALRERASDDVVLLAGVTPAAYAESLVRLARSASGGELPAPALAMARPSRLRERIVAILDPAIRRTAGSRACVLAAAAMAALATTVAAVEPAFTDIPISSAAVVFVEPAAVPQQAPVSVEPAAPRPEAPPTPAVQATSVICSSKIDRSSTSINDDDNRRRWKVELSGDGCKLVLQAEGRIEFTGDFTDVASIPSGGFLRIDATNRGTRRQLEITPGSSGLTRVWRVDGREAPYDDAARTWFAAFLVELDRRTAVGVDVRLPHLLSQGGVDAVLNETAQMPSDYARSTYYTRLARARKLSPAEVTRVLKQGASLTRSDHYAHQLIAAFAPSGVEDPAQREAVIGLIEGMDSDHYRAESIEALLARGSPSANEMDVLLRIVTRMSSDHYKVQTLTRVSRAGRLTPAHQATLLRAASTVASDHYAAEFLKSLMTAGPLSTADRQPLLAALQTIQSDHYAAEVLTMLLRDGQGIDAATILQLVSDVNSDHYRAEVLTALLTSTDRSEADLLGIVAAAAPMSDHYESTVLRRVVTHRAASERVHTAALDAAAKLSRHYGDEVRRAARRG
jgi:beta-lactamase regulating signal transducer with metallopeptidase domain